MERNEPRMELMVSDWVRQVHASLNLSVGQKEFILTRLMKLEDEFLAAFDDQLLLIA